MKARARRARALLRYRRRHGPPGPWLSRSVILKPVTGYDLYMIHRYGL